MLLSLAMLVILVKRLRDRDVPLRMAAVFGMVQFMRSKSKLLALKALTA